MYYTFHSTLFKVDAFTRNIKMEVIEDNFGNDVVSIHKIEQSQ